MPYHGARFIPLRQSCLPELAHYARSSPARISQACAPWLIRSSFATCVKRPLLYLASLCSRAVLKHISGGTSYQTVRLVFRPYAKLLPSICTSEPRTASSCLSSAFTDARHSSLVYRVACPQLCRLRCANGSSPHQLAVHMLSLVRVTRRGRVARLPAQFHLFSLFVLRSHYFSAIGLALYLALDGRCHPFTVQYQTLLLPHPVSHGAVTLSGRRFNAVAPTADISRSDCTRGCSFFARRYCRNPCKFLFRPLLICLIQRGVHALAVSGTCRHRCCSGTLRHPLRPSRTLR